MLTAKNSHPARILVVEDESVIRSSLRRLLERHQYQVQEAVSFDEVLQYQPQEFDLIISDLRLPGKGSGSDVVGWAKETTPVLIMTSYASVRSAVEVMKKGAYDYLAKPFDHNEMLESVSAILKRSAKQSVAKAMAANAAPTPEEAAPNNEIIMWGQCSQLQELKQKITKVAPHKATVLIQGESGTGKELVALSIHAQSPRANKPMIILNCAAIPDTLIEAELFGHEKGAFTGASVGRIGLVEAADNGTLFLDEIGELPLEAQARLLRVLQVGEVRRIGSIHTQHVDVRIIAATHRDLKQLAKEGRFREDLYYRLNVMLLTVPPLRDRQQDRMLMAQAFLTKMATKLHKPVTQFSKSAQNKINHYPWPGNIRELENTIERAVILAEGSTIDVELLELEQEPSGEPLPPAPADTNGLAKPQPDTDNALHETASVPINTGLDDEGVSLEDYFQQFVLEHQDQMTETELAHKLGISRKSLWERRQKLGIPRKKNT